MTMIVLSQRQLTIAWWAAVDAQDDWHSQSTAACQARHDRLPEGDRASYSTCHSAATLAVIDGCGVHDACTAAEDALRELAIPAGIP